MTIVCISYVIGHKVLNPINECGVKHLPDINPICGLMGWPCPDMYFSPMLLEKDLLTLSMDVRLKLPPFINPKCG